jgi:nitrate/nitrite transport system ATP-binding protein
MNEKPFLLVEGLAKRYPAPKKGQPEHVVFEDVSFGVKRGEFVTVIGHSGCGKSTILAIIAGLLAASAGYVFVAGREVKEPGLGRGVIFQNHSLLPWKTALGNVMFSVRARHPTWKKAQVLEHSRKYLALVGLASAEDKRPAQLSGGMRQRVGIARAFAIEPQILLMDEPFGALDALTRGSIQDQLVEICAQTGQTVFMITHDVDEAIYLSDRVFLMSNGPNARIAEQVEVPFRRPRSRTELSRHQDYYELRARLLDFLARAGAQGPERTDRNLSERAEPEETVEADGLEPLRSQRLEVSS